MQDLNDQELFNVKTIYIEIPCLKIPSDTSSLQFHCVAIFSTFVWFAFIFFLSSTISNITIKVSQMLAFACFQSSNLS